MTRVEYIRQLEFSLSGKLPPREVSEILRDYSEYFEAGRSEGKSEEEIAVSLGIPSAAAAQILSEIEEEKGYKKKAPQPEAEKKDPPLLKGWLERLKALLSRLSSFLGGLFDKLKPARKPAAPSPENPGVAAAFTAEGFRTDTQAAHNANAREEDVRETPEDAYPPPKMHKKKARPAARVGEEGSHPLLSVLLGLLMFPVILLALLFGGGLLALICIGIGALIIALCFLLLFFLAAAFAGSVGFSIAGGLGMPMSFILLFIVGLIFCLAGSVLTVCGLCYSGKGLVRLIRFCFGSLRWPDKARSAQHAQRTPNVYEDGWDAPTPPPSPVHNPAAYDRSSYESIYQQPIPGPQLHFGEEPPSENEENREENGHA